MTVRHEASRDQVIGVVVRLVVRENLEPAQSPVSRPSRSARRSNPHSRRSG